MKDFYDQTSETLDDAGSPFGNVAIEVIGYSPWVDSDRVKQLDRAIADLGREVKASRSARLDARWRASWRAFVRRWANERDSYKSWGDKLSPIEGGARVDAFGENYLWWSADFEARSGRAVPPVLPQAEALEVATPVWLIIGAACVAFAVVKGAK